MDAQKTLLQFKKKFDRELKSYLKRAVKEARKEDDLVADMLAYFSKTILADGKRLRPAMMYYGFLAGGGVASEQILKATMSVELVHGFILIQDDIIDRDDMRHGMLTMHAQYREYGKTFLKNDVGDIEATHFGEAVGIVTADIVHSIALNALLETGYPPERILASLQKIGAVIARTAVGEMQDVRIEYMRDIDEKKVLAMYENKTSRYTFEGPLQLGMGLAGASQELIDAASVPMLPLGIAFQIQDDILGVFGDQKKTGKPVGSDISEGKITFLVARAYTHADGAQKNTLDALLGKEAITQKDLTKFQHVLTETGAYDDARNLMREKLTQARAEIDALALPQEPKDFFLGITQYLENRTS